MPTILVILMLGFGMPALGLSWIPTSETFWGIVSLVLVYTAYVSEVYRAGLESVHPSQEAAARSLGLTRFQGLRYVIVPQAVRRVIPPLLNDFIGLQKDTALVSVIGAVEALQQASDRRGASFNFTPYVAAAVLFVAITIPLTRFTDYLIARERRAAAGGRGGRHDARCASRTSTSRSASAEVLKGIDLAVEEHEVVCLIGASGRASRRCSAA